MISPVSADQNTRLHKHVGGHCLLKLVVVNMCADSSRFVGAAEIEAIRCKHLMNAVDRLMRVRKVHEKHIVQSRWRPTPPGSNKVPYKGFIEQMSNARCIQFQQLTRHALPRSPIKYFLASNLDFYYRGEGYAIHK